MNNKTHYSSSSCCQNIIYSVLLNGTPIYKCTNCNKEIKKQPMIQTGSIKQEGKKFDQEKTRLELIPPEALEALGQILTQGAIKYSSRNWEQGMDWSRPYGAALRHLNAWWGGEDIDKEWNKSHLWHALTELVFLVTYEDRGIGNDNRHKIKKDGT